MMAGSSWACICHGSEIFNSSLNDIQMERARFPGKAPSLLLKTSKGLLPNDDGMLAWGKRGYETGLEDVLPQKV